MTVRPQRESRGMQARTGLGRGAPPSLQVHADFRARPAFEAHGAPRAPSGIAETSSSQSFPVTTGAADSVTGVLTASLPMVTRWLPLIASVPTFAGA